MIGQKDQYIRRHERCYPFTQSLETRIFLEIGILGRKLDSRNAEIGSDQILCSMGVIKTNAFRV